MTTVRLSKLCTTLSHCTLHLVSSRWSWVLGSSSAAAVFAVRMLRDATKDEGELVRSTHWPDPLRFDAQDCDNLIRGTTSADLYPLHRGSVGRQGVLAPKATEAAHGV